MNPAARLAGERLTLVVLDRVDDRLEAFARVDAGGQIVVMALDQSAHPAQHRRVGRQRILPALAVEHERQPARHRHQLRLQQHAHQEAVQHHDVERLLRLRHRGQRLVQCLDLAIVQRSAAACCHRAVPVSIDVRAAARCNGPPAMVARARTAAAGAHRR
ncbi:MAG: hypothetical protein MUC68_17540 [Burkholderiaceae bacterium]|nr:hypothetical protein [Burkholderiaceae bacterium]